MLKFYIGSVVFYFISISVVALTAKYNFVRNDRFSYWWNMALFEKFGFKLLISIIPVFRMIIFVLLLFTSTLNKSAIDKQMSDYNKLNKYRNDGD